MVPIHAFVSLIGSGVRLVILHIVFILVFLGLVECWSRSLLSCGFSVVWHFVHRQSSVDAL